jgi:hypothetical protein
MLRSGAEFKDAGSIVDELFRLEDAAEFDTEVKSSAETSEPSVSHEGDVDDTNLSDCDRGGIAAKTPAVTTIIKSFKSPSATTQDSFFGEYQFII